MLFKVLRTIEEATEIKPLPFSTNQTRNAIAYNYRIFSDDGAVAQSILELRIIDKGMLEVDTIAKKIKQSIVKLGDGSKIEGLTSVVVNGESYLPIDDEIMQKIVNLNLIYRSDI